MIGIFDRGKIFLEIASCNQNPLGRLDKLGVTCLAVTFKLILSWKFCKLEVISRLLSQFSDYAYFLRCLLCFSSPFHRYYVHVDIPLVFDDLVYGLVLFHIAFFVTSY